jgi:hypothetical protein
MIISCSRRTDIPAFYSDWFFNRLREGYVLVRNPMNRHQLRQVALDPAVVDCIVFWTKDPAPMLHRLHLLKEYHYYFQFTLTPYGKDIEPNLPPKDQIIDTFLTLADKIGKKRVVWRYDPILLSEDVGIEYHLEHFARLAERLSGHTEKCIISFMDMYRHLQAKLASRFIRPPGEVEMRTLAEKITAIAGANDIRIETCAEAADLAAYGIQHGKCIDDQLIEEITGRKMKFEKDNRQRELCGCVASIDIGEYNTCSHLCKYCYANSSQKTVAKNISLHNDEASLPIGEPNEKQKIANRRTAPLFHL